MLLAPSDPIIFPGLLFLYDTESSLSRAVVVQRRRAQLVRQVLGRALMLSCGPKAIPKQISGNPPTICGVAHKPVPVDWGIFLGGEMPEVEGGGGQGAPKIGEVARIASRH